jgi:hypothetical protein
MSVKEFVYLIQNLYRTCWNNLATSLIIATRLLQVVNSLFHTCWQLATSSAKTTCWRLVGRLATRCELFARVAKNSCMPTSLQQVVFGWVTTLCRQPCIIPVISWLHQTCQNNLVTSLVMPSSLLQVVNSLVSRFSENTSNLTFVFFSSSNPELHNITKMVIASLSIRPCFPFLKCGWV